MPFRFRGTLPHDQASDAVPKRWGRIDQIYQPEAEGRNPICHIHSVVCKVTNKTIVLLNGIQSGESTLHPGAVNGPSVSVQPQCQCAAPVLVCSPSVSVQPQCQCAAPVSVCSPSVSVQPQCQCAAPVFAGLGLHNARLTLDSLDRISLGSTVHVLCCYLFSSWKIYFFICYQVRPHFLIAALMSPQRTKQFCPQIECSVV